MTERLYYRDSFLRSFDAQVVSCEKEGERWRVVLDRTAFYPTSGGQPHDTGKLDDVPVVEVADDAEQKVVHYTSAAIKPGPVHGEIDWARRIDHMQQHTGQHLLSAAFIELFKFPTVSFHLGKESSTIDLAAPSIVARHLEEAERRTNEIILEDRPIVIRFGTAEELAEAGIRKKVEREGILRAIEVEGFDRQPCGGTHLERTGQAGLLLLRKLERRRDSWRLEFVCGLRALATARGDYATLGKAAQQLSCGLPDVPAVLGKLVEKARGSHNEVEQLEKRLAIHEARELLAANSAPTGVARLIAAVLDQASLTYLHHILMNLLPAGNVVAFLASRGTGFVMFGKMADTAGDMAAIFRKAAEELGAKGGGSATLAQGSLSDPSKADAFVTRAKELYLAAR
ncbi:MAG: alanine--tRNA ligase-related protein [Candidatus Acidiferrales bacterium]